MGLPPQCPFDDSIQVEPAEGIAASATDAADSSNLGAFILPCSTASHSQHLWYSHVGGPENTSQIGLNDVDVIIEDKNPVKLFLPLPSIEKGSALNAGDALAMVVFALQFRVRLHCRLDEHSLAANCSRNCEVVRSARQVKFAPWPRALTRWTGKPPVTTAMFFRQIRK